MDNSSQKEIDLLELLARFFRSLKRNLIFTILFPVIGVITGLIVHSKTDGKISSEMLIGTDLMSPTESAFWVNQFRQTESLPSLSPALADQLSRINYEAIFSTDPEIKRSFIKVSVKVSNAEIFPELEKNIVDYINQLDVIVRHRKQLEAYYIELIKDMDAQLESMDALKKDMGASKATLLNPADLYVEGVELREKKLKYELFLADARSLEIIKHFSELQKAERASPLLYVLIGLAVGFALLLSFMAIRGFLDYYHRFEKSFGA